MLELNGYKIEKEVRASSNSTAYQGKRAEDSLPVFIKWYYLSDDTSNDRNLRTLKNEFEIMTLLSSENIVKAYKVLESKDGCGLVLEDFGGKSLREVSKENKIDIKTFLKVAIPIAEALGRVHHNEVIHKDINPGNIIVNSSNWKVKLTDFGIATLLTRETQELVIEEQLEGTLAYISPEQTGRMNRAVDYRTDIYSLGMTFYELLAGKLPFQADDTIGWIHNHIAVTPASPTDENAEIPAVLSRILLKMVEKNAEDRYQSATGIKQDLEKCLQLLEKDGKIGDFEVAKDDVSGRFQISEKLYGREAEIKVLMDAFNSVAEADISQMLLVAGFSGIGKSVLIKEVHRPIVEKRGYFISGKHDQFKRNIPFSAMIQAFEELVFQLVSESEERLKDWKNKLLEALGSNGQVILDVIPELGLVIGKQPAVMELGPAESQARFNMTFQRFIKVFTQKEHPLVMFLDDLQWADSATLNLLKVLMTDVDSRDLFVIGAYRDNEVNPAHPFIMMLEEVKETSRIVNTITLTPLKEEHITTLVSDSLQTSVADAKPLAKLVMDKTEGNPFFVREFLRTLQDEGLLRFNFDKRKWEYDAKEINAKGITDNVVDLMVKRMKKLPEGTQEALQLAACIGNIFDLKTLSLVSEKTLSQSAADLWPAIKEGLLMPMGDSKELLKVSGDNVSGLSTTQALKATDKFLHDRVQQAAYAMIAEDQRKVVHLKIGRLLMKNFSPEELEENLFDVTRQVNEGREMITDSAEKLKLLDLNLRTGKKAKASTAFDSAADYLSIAKDLLPEQSWKTNYDLTIDIYWELAENNYILTHFEEMEALGKQMLDNATSVLHKLKVYELRVLALFAESKLADAISVGFEGLKMLGIKFPKKPVLPHVLGNVMKTKIAMRKTPPEALVDLPLMTDEAMIVAMRILNGLTPAAYWLKTLYLPLIVLKMCRLSVKYGNCPVSLQGYGLFGAINCSILGDIETGYRLSKAAMKLGERPENREFMAPSITVPNFGSIHFKEHMRSCVKGPKSQMAAYQAAMEAGKLDHAGLALINQSYFVFYAGENLAKSAEELKHHVDLLKQYRQMATQNTVEVSLQNIQNLLGQNEDPLMLNGDSFNEDQFSFLQEIGNETSLGYAYVYKLQLAFLFEKYDKALEYATEGAKFLEALLGMPHNPLYFTFLSLASLGQHANVPANQQKKLLKTVGKNQKMVKKWADHCPENYLNKYHIVEAEKARVLGQDNAAIELYDKAINGAIENEFIQDEALANELFAKFWISRGKKTYARLHMTEARRLYHRWGAQAKVQQLEATYQQYMGRDTTAGAGTAGDFATTTTVGAFSTTTAQPTSSSGQTSSSGAIDLGTVVKATRTMAGEIKLSRLLGTMMTIVMENAGGRRGFLFLEKEGEMMLAALSDMEQNKTETDISISLSEIEKEGTQLAASIVRYVARTKENIVLTDASKEEKFSMDGYIKNQKPRSILCSPIINQGRLTGLLYLENNLSAGAFTPQRLEVLSMLSSQAAVSLENAVLYDSMETKVEERTKEVKDILTNVKQGIFTLNQDYNLTGGYSGMVPKIFEGNDFTRVQELHMDELAQALKLNEYLEMLFTSPYANQKLIENANPLRKFDYNFTNAKGKPQMKILSFSFSRIFETDSDGKETKTVQKLMVVVDDKTDEFALKKELEQKADEQASKVEKLYQILQLDSNVFSNFISESSTTLDEVYSQLRALGDDTEKNKEILRIIFREVHTLKGNARALNLDSIGKTAHELEDVFDELKENPERITQELKDKTNDAVRILKDEIQDGNSLFEKILNMQQSLQTKSKDVMSEFEDRFRNIVAIESKESGKTVEFEFNNELPAPLEASVLNKLRNPLSHIVRNSVSHGIEATSSRLKNSKSETGLVKLHLSRKDGTLMVVCEDDGGGLDTEKIRKKAEKMKLFSPDELKKMSDNEINKLIFSSGLSTQEKVTDAAGRGVGMDAVKEELKSLKALIAISTKKNEYTRFTIKIPEG